MDGLFCFDFAALGDPNSPMASSSSSSNRFLETAAGVTEGFLGAAAAGFLWIVTGAGFAA